MESLPWEEENPSSCHLFKLASVYHFRVVVPFDLREVVGLREIRYSLRTGYLTLAKYRALQMVSFVHRFFRTLRRRSGLRALTANDIKRILDLYFRRVLEDDEDLRCETEEAPHRQSLHRFTHIFITGGEPMIPFMMVGGLTPSPFSSIGQIWISPGGTYEQKPTWTDLWAIEPMLVRDPRANWPQRCCGPGKPCAPAPSTRYSGRTWASPARRHRPSRSGGARPGLHR
jgi:hypothetical protein